MKPQGATHQRQDGSAFYKRGIKFWMVFKNDTWVETRIPNDWSMMPIYRKD